jgi:hypothetical protein
MVSLELLKDLGSLALVSGDDIGDLVQQRSTATTALFVAFGFIQMRPDQREQGQSGYCAEFGTKRSRRAACPRCAPD